MKSYRYTKRFMLLTMLVVCLETTAWAAVAPNVSLLGAVNTQIYAPQKIALVPEGGFLVSDARGNTVTRFSATWEPQQVFRMPKTPGALAVSADGSAFFVGLGKYVGVYTRDGQEVNKIGLGALKFVGGIALDDTGNLFVVDTLANAVKKFSPSGTTLNTISGAGTTGGLLRFPTGIAIEKKSGQLVVADTANGRIQFFDKYGTFVKSIGSIGAGALKFAMPVDLAFDYAQGDDPARLYVLDSFQAVVQVIDPSGAGAFLSYLGGYGIDNGYLVAPAGMVFDSADQQLLVANGYGNVTRYTVSDSPLPPPSNATGLTVDAMPSSTKTNQITLTGTATGGEVFVTNGSGAPVQATVTGNVWQATVTLNEGANFIHVTTATGDRQTLAAVTIVSDPNASNPSSDPVPPAPVTPVLTLSAIADGSITGRQVQNISGFVTGTGSINARVNGRAVSLNNGVFSTAIVLDVGPNLISVVANDASGNPATITRTIFFNPKAPALTIASPSDCARVRNSLVVISGSVDPNASVSVNGLAATVANGAFSEVASLTDGMNTVEVEAVSQAGVRNKQKRTVYYDANAPEVSIDTPDSDLATSANTVTLAATASEAPTDFLFNGRRAAAASQNGRFVFSATLSLPGENVLELKSGNSSSLRSVIYQPHPPLVTIGDAGKMPATLSGTVSPGAVVIAKDKTGVIGTVHQAGTTWSIDFTGNPPDANTLEVEAVDAAGNRSSITLSGVFGDVNGDGVFDLADILTVLQVATGAAPITPQILSRGDVGPIVNGVSQPDGKITMVDVVALLRRFVALPGGN